MSQAKAPVEKENSVLTEKKDKRESWPCRACNKNVIDEYIQCEICDYWFYSNCQNKNHIKYARKS